MSRNDRDVAVSGTRHPAQRHDIPGMSCDMSGKCRVVSFASTKKRKTFRGRVQVRRAARAMNVFGGHITIYIEYFAVIRYSS